MEMSMGIKVAMAGLVFAVLGLVACADVVDRRADGDDLAERAASEAAHDSALEARDQGPPAANPCQQACIKAYIACVRHGDSDPEACQAEAQACLLECVDWP
jgi:hypothetical protein